MKVQVERYQQMDRQRITDRPNLLSSENGANLAFYMSMGSNQNFNLYSVKEDLISVFYFLY